jgi:phage-related minor tail protein
MRRLMYSMVAAALLMLAVATIVGGFTALVALVLLAIRVFGEWVIITMFIFLMLSMFIYMTAPEDFGKDETY